VAVFPELTLSGYAIDDLVMQDALLDAVLTAVDTVVEGSRDLRPVLVVGAPLRVDNRLYNCAVVVHRARSWGGPKSYLPTYREFYERAGTPRATTGAADDPVAGARCRSAAT
jgi:NAD+ synthase (glutamine-hydrolysing)